MGVMEHPFTRKLGFQPSGVTAGAGRRGSRVPGYMDVAVVHCKLRVLVLFTAHFFDNG